jgi:tRNA modification GTPase
MLEDTIVAISTPVGQGGLGVVRLSGKKSLPVVKKIFRPKKKGAKILGRRPLLGNLFDFEQKEFFEEAFLTFYPQPHTYTREDMVEISCHGSPVILEQVVRLAIKAGARHAHPGEFTLRAYLNGRIDILQAEAVNDLIRAVSYKQAKISFHQLEGRLSGHISSLRDQVLHLLSQIEARIEFPEERLRTSTARTARTLESLIQSIKKLIDSYNLGKALTEGITLAITGRANVGKSTLFNSLLERDRAIVTPHPGTTRDYLSEKMEYKDSVFTLIDMAGLGKPLHPVEKEGIKRGKRLAFQADGILLLLDTSLKESPEDFRLIDMFKDKKTILLFNKIDLPQKMNKEEVKNRARSLTALEISALKGTNLGKLKAKIHALFIPDLVKDQDIIFHMRQKLILEEILAFLVEGRHLLEQGYPEEVYVEEFRKTIPLIGRLAGEIRSDDIINEIFNRFCVGK